MACPQDKNELVLQVRQGENRGFGFTIKQDGTPFDLTQWTINFMVKEAPYESLSPIIAKEITTTSDSATVGQIYNPTGGQFSVVITTEETLLPPYDYYLVITMGDGQQIVNISGDGNEKAVFRVCTQ